VGGGAVNGSQVLLLSLLGAGLYVGARGTWKRRRKRRSRFVLGRWLRRGPGTCYRFRVRHPRSGRVVNGYVGQTRRPVQVRIDEHLLGTATAAPKVWADTVVSWDVLWTGTCTQGGLNWRERWYIVSRRPLYNVQWNTANRRRILPSRAARQRIRRSQTGRNGWRWVP